MTEFVGDTVLVEHIDSRRSRFDAVTGVNLDAKGHFTKVETVHRFPETGRMVGEMGDDSFRVLVEATGEVHEVRLPAKADDAVIRGFSPKRHFLISLDRKLPGLMRLYPLSAGERMSEEVICWPVRFALSRKTNAPFVQFDNAEKVAVWQESRDENDSEYVIWDLNAGRERNRIRLSSERSILMDVSPGGRWLRVAVNAPTQVNRIYDIASGKMQLEFPGGDLPLTYSDDERRCLVTHRDESQMVHDLVDNRVVWKRAENVSAHTALDLRHLKRQYVAGKSEVIGRDLDTGDTLWKTVPLAPFHLAELHSPYLVIKLDENDEVVVVDTTTGQIVSESLPQIAHMENRYTSISG